MINEKIRSYLIMTLLVICLFLQVTFIPQFFFGNYIPNIVLLLLLAISVLNNKYLNVFFLAFFSGLILDFFSGSNFGLLCLSLLLAIFVSSYLSHYFLKEIFSYNLFLISCCSVLIYNLIYLFLVNVFYFQQVIANWEQLVLIIVFQMIYTIVLIYPLTYILFCKKCK